MISEVMLQQTQVATVIAYFERWIEKVSLLSSTRPGEDDWASSSSSSRARDNFGGLQQFPTIYRLAEASNEEVHALWVSPSFTL